MVGTPWFGALWITCKALWQIINTLEANFALHVISILAEHDITKIFFKIFANDKDHFAKTCTHSVKHAIVHDCFAVWSETIQLFQSSVTATHTSRKDKKSRFIHVAIIYIRLIYYSLDISILP